MIAYFFVLLLIVFAFFHYDVNGNYKSWKFICLLEMIVLILIVTCQWRLGGDNLSYEIYYKDIPTFENLNVSELVIGAKYQPLWYIFTSLLKSVTPSYVFFHFAHTTFLTLITFWFTRKYTRYTFSVILLYVLSFNFFFFNIEIQRESMAVMIFLIMFKYLEKGSYIKYYLLWPVSFLFHMSSVFLLIIPLMLVVLKRMTSFSKLLIFTIIGAVLLITVFRSLMESYLTFVDSDVAMNVLNQASYYNEGVMNFVNSFLMGIIGSIPVFILVFIRIKGKLPFDVFTQLCILYIIIRFCNGYVIGIYRFGNYLLIPYYVCLVNTFGALYKYQKYRMALYLILAFMAVFTVYSETRPAPFLGPDMMHGNMYIPYRSIFD